MLESGQDRRVARWVRLSLIVGCKPYAEVCNKLCIATLKLERLQGSRCCGGLVLFRGTVVLVVVVVWRVKRSGRHERRSKSKLPRKIRRPTAELKIKGSCRSVGVAVESHKVVTAQAMLPKLHKSPQYGDSRQANLEDWELPVSVIQLLQGKVSECIYSAILSLS